MNPVPRIDADILRYEVSSCGEFIGLDGNLVVKHFDTQISKLHSLIDFICEEVDTTEEPILYLSPTKEVHRMMYRYEIKHGLDHPPFIPNFRIARAVTKEYKGNRDKSKPKPFHFDNILMYMLANFKCKVAWGMEADDLLCIDQTKCIENSIICTRDKDLRMMPGNHFGWECGAQPQFGPKLVDAKGHIYPKFDGKGKISEIKGWGYLFFLAQLIVGDSTDNIPGLEGSGPTAANSLLSDWSKSQRKAVRAVAELYKKKYKSNWRERMQEQADLLWMVREVDSSGQPVMWNGINKYCEGM